MTSTHTHTPTGHETHANVCAAWQEGTRRLATLSLRGEPRGVWTEENLESAKSAARKALPTWSPELRWVTYSDDDFRAVVSLSLYQGFDDGTVSLTDVLAYSA